jgi:hypothetical protein
LIYLLNTLEAIVKVDANQLALLILILSSLLPHCIHNLPIITSSSLFPTMSGESSSASIPQRKAKGPATVSTGQSSPWPAASSPRDSMDIGEDTSRYSHSQPETVAKHKFKSYRLRGPYEKPWMSDPAVKKTKWNNWIVWGWIVAGFIGAAAIVFFTIMPYRDGEVCFIY